MKNPQKYIAYDPVQGDMAFFSTMDDARKWIFDAMAPDDFNELPEEVMLGRYFIARIIERSGINIEGRREDYPCEKRPQNTAHCSICDEADCEGTNEWPYGPDTEYAGYPIMVQVIHED